MFLSYLLFLPDHFVRVRVSSQKTEEACTALKLQQGWGTLKVCVYVSSEDEPTTWML